MEATVGDTEVEKSVQCSICHFSFSSSNIPILSKEYNLAKVQNVCSTYLSPTLLCPDNFQNNGFPKLFPSFFCPDCVKAICELIEIHENLVRIQLRVKEFADDFSKNALNCRHKVKSKRKRKTFFDRNKAMKMVSLSESPNWRNSGRSTQQSPFSVGNFQSKDFRICLERIDSVTGNLNSCTSSMADESPRKLIPLKVLDDSVREDNLNLRYSLLKNGCIDNPIVESQGKNILETVSCSKRRSSNEEMSMDLEDGVFCGSSEANIANNKNGDDTPKLDVNIEGLSSRSQSSNSHVKGFQLKEFSICLERIDSAKIFLSNGIAINGSISSSVVQSTRDDSGNEDIEDEDSNNYMYPPSYPYTEGTTSSSRGLNDRSEENEAVNNQDTFLLINNCQTEPTAQIEDEAKEVCTTLERVYQNKVIKDSQDLPFENEDMSDTMSQHSRMENSEAEEKFEIEEFMDYVYEDSSFLALETSDSDTKFETLECGILPLAPAVEGISNHPEDSPAEKDVEENDIVAVRADDSIDCAEVSHFSGRIKRKAAIKANSKILRVTKEVINSESGKDIILSPEASSYEESTDAASECDSNEERYFEKGDKKIADGKRGRKFNSKTWTTSREKKSNIKGRNLQKLTKTNKTEIPYECQVCHEKFSYMDYINHSRFSECPIICGEGESANFDCGDCGKKFKAKYLMLHHSAKQHNDCKCNLCNYTGHKFDHFLKHTNETACICDICGMPFLRFKYFKEHRMTHIGDGQGYSTVTECQTINEICYECKTCQKKFPVFNEFTAHVRNSQCPVNPRQGKETTQLFQCDKCKDTFKAEYLLLHHRANEHNSGKCGVCNKKTILSDYDHFVLHTGEIPCYCDICGKPIKQFCIFKSHRLTHIGRERIHLCDRQDCSREFKTINALKKHLAWHKNVEKGKTFSCKICQKEYTRKDTLDKHVKSHSRKYLCNDCGKTFTTDSALYVHIQRHTGYLFPCTVCDKKFSTKNFLNQHYRVEHLKNEKRYPCSFCDQGFDLHSVRNDHIRVSHTGEKPFECQKCGESFPAKRNLKIHQERRHSTKKFECHICKKILSDKHSLRTHIRNVHSRKEFKCDACDRSFSTSFNLTTHKRSHSGVKPYQCDECGKTFTRKDNLTTHVKMHAKDKQGSLKCKICGDSFANKKNMSEHIKIIHNDSTRPNKITIESESEPSSGKQSDDESY